MEFKPGEIIAIVFALALPVAGFAVLFIPGGLNAIVDFVLHSGMQPFVFYGGAGIVFLILAWRVYRRMRSRQRKPD